MKTLLQINSAINTGSTGKIAEKIGEKATEHGWRSYIAHGARYSRGTNLIDISHSSSLGEKIHYLGSLLTDGEGCYSIRSTKELIKNIEAISPDIIHLHNIHGHYFNYKIFFKYIKHAKIPVVWTLHDCWAFTGHCVYFDLIGCNKWQTKCLNCPLKRQYPKSLIDRSSFNYEQKKKAFSELEGLTLVPVSRWLSDLLGESYLKNHPRRVIHNGIDLDLFSPQALSIDVRSKYGIPVGKQIVLGVADGFGKRKGLDDFIYLSEHLDERYAVVLVGIKKEIKSSKIYSIRHTDNQHQLALLYNAASVFVNPTYEDNYPTVNMEAIACGTPVITYNTGGSPESITPETGIVVPKGNVAELQKAIIDITSYKEIDRYSPTLCRQSAESLFNKDERFNEYIDLYEEIMSS